MTEQEAWNPARISLLGPVMLANPFSICTTSHFKGSKLKWIPRCDRLTSNRGSYATHLIRGMLVAFSAAD